MTNEDKFVYNVNLKTPFYAAKKYVGIESKDCICIQLKEIEDLNNNFEDAIINFNINFSQFRVNETRTITLKELNNLLEQHRAKIWTTFDHIDMVNIHRSYCNLI